MNLNEAENSEKLIIKKINLDEKIKNEMCKRRIAPGNNITKKIVKGFGQLEIYEINNNKIALRKEETKNIEVDKYE